MDPPWLFPLSQQLPREVWLLAGSASATLANLSASWIDRHSDVVDVQVVRGNAFVGHVRVVLAVF